MAATKNDEALAILAAHFADDPANHRNRETGRKLQLALGLREPDENDSDDSEGNSADEE